MTDVQIGQSLSLTPLYRSLPPRAWLSPIKFEEKEKWNVIDTAIVEIIVCITTINERSEISYRELINRLRKELHVDESYLLEAVPRLLRIPPSGIDGTVRRFEFCN